MVCALFCICLVFDVCVCVCVYVHVPVGCCVWSSDYKEKLSIYILQLKNEFTDSAREFKAELRKRLWIGESTSSSAVKPSAVKRKVQTRLTTSVERKVHARITHGKSISGKRNVQTRLTTVTSDERKVRTRITHGKSTSGKQKVQTLITHTHNALPKNSASKSTRTPFGLYDQLKTRVVKKRVNLTLAQKKIICLSTGADSVCAYLYLINIDCLDCDRQFICMCVCVCICCACTYVVRVTVVMCVALICMCWCVSLCFLSHMCSAPSRSLAKQYRVHPRTGSCYVCVGDM